MVAHAQNKSDTSAHLTFKGVPISGTLENFILKMKRAGFSHKVTKDGVAMLEGDFASYKRCTVGVWTSKPKNLVSRIGVIFPECQSWSSLSSNYFDLKELLTEKYGEPSEAVEKFQSYTPEDDGSKLIQVRLGACKYYTTYETEKGTIQLSIGQSEATNCFIRLVYHDKINGAEVKKEALDDL